MCLILCDHQICHLEIAELLHPFIFLQSGMAETFRQAVQRFIQPIIFITHLSLHI